MAQNLRKNVLKFLSHHLEETELDDTKTTYNLLRLHEQNNEVELAIHVFPGKPKIQGMLCPGEDQTVYRRGAQRWTKSYRVNGHIFEAKRFNKKAFCTYCQDRIWGLGRQGFKCFQCKLMIHKKCHLLIHVKCDIR